MGEEGSLCQCKNFKLLFLTSHTPSVLNWRGYRPRQFPAGFSADFSVDFNADFSVDFMDFNADFSVDMVEISVQIL